MLIFSYDYSLILCLLPRELSFEKVTTAGQHYLMGMEQLALYTNGDVTEMALSSQGVEFIQKLLAVAGGSVGEGLHTHPLLQGRAFGLPVQRLRYVSKPERLVTGELCSSSGFQNAALKRY